MAFASAPLVEPVEESADLSVHVRGVGEHSGAERFDSPSSQIPDCPKGARLIPLGGKYGKGLFAVVDADDFEHVSRVSWFCQAGRRYVMGKIRGRLVYMHRLIMGALTGEEIDHADGDPLNNCRANLRRCTRAENCANRRPTAKWGFKGIGKARRQFSAVINRDGERFYLGLFKTPEEAARAYDTAAKQFFGPFACLNFPDESAVVHATDNVRGARQCPGQEAANHGRKVSR